MGTNSPIVLSRKDDILLVAFDSPPVNALSRAMREGLIAAMTAAADDADVSAVVLIGAGKAFIAGADITEFGKEVGGPTFKDVQDAMDGAAKPIIAAIHGTALGGGLEVAMCAHYRIAVPSARLGLPEVKLGLVPGAGGTQRLPRLVGMEKALEMIAGGEPIGAKEALALGLLDELAPENELKNHAIAFARKLIANGAGPRRTRDLEEKIAHVEPALFSRFREKTNFRGLEAPKEALRCLEAARLPFDEGIAFERAVFEACKASPQSAALRYAFFAERKAAKVRDLPSDILPISQIGIVGAGTMGSGIATSFVNAGFSVKIAERNAELLARGLSAVKKNLDSSVKRGRLSAEEAQRRLGLVEGVETLDGLAGADLIIEAVFERMEAKLAVFSALDKIAKPGAILASNTSYLDIDAMARATTRASQVLGLHFFSPAHVMKLVEIVEGERTSRHVIATAAELAKRIGKVGVVVRAGYGFVGNRMLAERTREAQKLVLEGALPWDVDRVLTTFGFPMGPFQMGDLAGLDLGWVRGESKGETLRDRLNELGRHGQKSGAGYYDYDQNRKGKPSPVTERLITELMAERRAVPRSIPDDEILERCLYPMLNEAANILKEGKALRPSDIDVVWLNGYGWPRYRGGPIYYADQLGLAAILDGIRKYRWTPSPLLEDLVNTGRRFGDLPSQLL